MSKRLKRLLREQEVKEKVQDAALQALTQREIERIFNGRKFVHMPFARLQLVERPHGA